MTFSGVAVERARRAVALVDAARALAEESGTADFTVADVARRAGSSLKGFYGCFASKDDLVLALLRHDSERGAAVMAPRIVGVEGIARVRTFIETMFELIGYPESRSYATLAWNEYRRLGTTHRRQILDAVAPLSDLLEVVCSARDARYVLSLVLAGIGDVLMDGADPRATGEAIAAFCERGVQPRG